MARRPRTLLADPPWPFRDRLPGGGRGAAKHYQCMSLEQICLFPIPRMADDSWLFLCRVASQQEAALAVMRAWGYTLKSEVVWVKTTDNPRLGPSRLQIGMGRYVRNCHETVLIGVRGKAREDRLSASIPSVIFAPRGRHSEKPEALYRLIESLAPGPRVELFARKHRKGWACLGEELEPETNA